MVVIRLGDRVYNGEEGSEGYRLFRFLNAIMYPHEDDFMDTISEYIDFSVNEELWKETNGMFSLGQCIREEGIRAFVIDSREEGISEERTIEKLQRHFRLSKEKAETYYVQFIQEEE